MTFVSVILQKCILIDLKIGEMKKTQFLIGINNSHDPISDYDHLFLKQSYLWQVFKELLGKTDAQVAKILYQTLSI